MAKTFKLNGQIHLVDMTTADLQSFISPVVEAVPADSMGTVQIQITGEGVSAEVAGASKDELTASVTAFFSTRPTPAATQSQPLFDMQATLNLVHLSYLDGCEVIDAAKENMPQEGGALKKMRMEVEEEAA